MSPRPRTSTGVVVKLLSNLDAVAEPFRVEMGQVAGVSGPRIIQAAKAASAADQTGKVEAAYDHIRVWCELVVKGELLAKVTQRHQPNVAMTNLERIKPDRLKAAVGVILPIFERARRYIPGHSHPLETLGVRPKVEELIADWADLQEVGEGLPVELIAARRIASERDGLRRAPCCRVCSWRTR